MKSTVKDLGGILKSSLHLQSIGLAKNFIQVFPQDVLEKLEGIFGQFYHPPELEICPFSPFHLYS